MFNKKLLIAVTLLTSNLLPITTQVHAENYIDYELCNDLNFGTEEEYPLDLNSNVAMTTKLVKEENDDLVIYLYDPTANFKYDSSLNYKIYMNYCNDKVSVDEWSSHVYISKNFNVTFDGTTTNGTITKWIITDFVDDYNVDFNNFRSYLINNIHAENYIYILSDHFVLSPVDEKGYSDLQYTQSNVVTLSDVAVAGWAIDNSYPTWWDKLIGPNYEKQLVYFYGFNIDNFINIENIYNVTIQYNLYENGLYFTTSPYVNSWENRLEYIESEFSETKTINLKYDSSKTYIDKGYKHSYDYKTYEFEEISTVKDMLLENSNNNEFVNYMGSKFSNCTYVCSFANFEYITSQVNATESWVNQHRDKPSSGGGGGSGGSIRSGANDNKLANWIYENKDNMEKKFLLFENTYFFYRNECPEVKDINMIQMHFKANGIEYDLPVKAQPVPEVPPGNVGEDPGKQDDNIDWEEIIAIAFVCLIAITVLLILLKDLFKLLIRGIAKIIVWLIKVILKIIGFILNFAISLITYPFRFIFGHKEFFLWKC